MALSYSYLGSWLSVAIEITAVARSPFVMCSGLYASRIISLLMGNQRTQLYGNIELCTSTNLSLYHYMHHRYNMMQYM